VHRLAPWHYQLYESTDLTGYKTLKCVSYEFQPVLCVRLSVGDSVFSLVLTFRINYSHFGWKPSWKSILRFSQMWEPIRRTEIRNSYKRKERTGWDFKWKYESNSQGLGVHCSMTWCLSVQGKPNRKGGLHCF
jgi:hypothetical protein